MYVYVQVYHYYCYFFFFWEFFNLLKAWNSAARPPTCVASIFFLAHTMTDRLPIACTKSFSYCRAASFLFLLVFCCWLMCGRRRQLFIDYQKFALCLLLLLFNPQWVTSIWLQSFSNCLLWYLVSASCHLIPRKYLFCCLQHSPPYRVCWQAHSWNFRTLAL